MKQTAQRKRRRERIKKIAADETIEREKERVHQRERDEREREREDTRDRTDVKGKKKS